eukprot:354646-Chlamydomonas_euryale.AAC.6
MEGIHTKGCRGMTSRACRPEVGEENEMEGIHAQVCQGMTAKGGGVETVQGGNTLSLPAE